ncbi:response regulator [Magnetovibrio sp. PR-2]|uniref:response regulator n=1 Tax=Magnetovibrio sp. PR-2 TaxID=3120356 RepID=UPI002FCE216C
MGQQCYLSKIKFLIVDDNTFMRTIIRRILMALGVHDVLEARDGAEALQILQSCPVDIVLLDWEMTPFDGIEFAHMVRTSDDIQTPYMPIIMISGYSEYWRISAARDAGVTEFLVKPISANSLFSRIRNVIENPRPFVAAPGFFGPDRRRHDVAHDEERREHGPNEIAPDRSMSQDEINTYFNSEPGAARLAKYHSENEEDIHSQTH